MLKKVILQGRLTADAELKTTNSGKTVTSFTLASERNFKGSDGNREADFFNCVAWGNTAENITKYFHKGDMMLAVGELQNRKWTDKEGKNRIETEVIVSETYFCGSKSKADAPQYAPSNVKIEPISEDEELPF